MCPRYGALCSAITQSAKSGPNAKFHADLYKKHTICAVMCSITNYELYFKCRLYFFYFLCCRTSVEIKKKSFLLQDFSSHLPWIWLCISLLYSRTSAGDGRCCTRGQSGRWIAHMLRNEGSRPMPSAVASLLSIHRQTGLWYDGGVSCIGGC